MSFLFLSFSFLSFYLSHMFSKYLKEFDQEVHDILLICQHCLLYFWHIGRMKKPFRCIFANWVLFLSVNERLKLTVCTNSMAIFLNILFFPGNLKKQELKEKSAKMCKLLPMSSIKWRKSLLLMKKPLRKKQKGKQDSNIRSCMS